MGCVPKRYLWYIVKISYLLTNTLGSSSDSGFVWPGNLGKLCFFWALFPPVFIMEIIVPSSWVLGSFLKMTYVKADTG